jgi:antitoxin (DNA-binding transcriptional repressor) of toxin-antitoxin stability system
MLVAIRELKSHFSKYLKKVQTGEEIIITTHGKPIARFSQIGSNNNVSAEDILQNLAWIRKGDGDKPKGLADELRIKLTSGKNLSDMLLDDRE